MKVFDYAFYKLYQGFKNFIDRDSKFNGTYGFVALSCMSLFLFFNQLSIVEILKKMETGTRFFDTIHIGPLYYLALCLLLFGRYFNTPRNKKIIQKYDVIDRFQRENSSSYLWIYIAISVALFLFSLYFRRGYQ
jgi:hypothetical protein